MEKLAINRRFIEAVDYLLSTGVVDSKGSLANNLGIKNTKFSEILNLRMNIGTDLAAVVCEKYNISPEWLLLGKGSMMQQNLSDIPQPVMEQEKSGEASAYYKMYKEKDEENKVLLKENAVLQERLRLIEHEPTDFGDSAETSVSTGSSLLQNIPVTSAGVRLKE